MSNLAAWIQETRERISGCLERRDYYPLEPSPLPARTPPGSPLAAYFDHTALKPDAGAEVFAALCREAESRGTASVCLPPNRVGIAAEMLRGSGVKVCTVIGFPLGYNDPRSKADEVRRARELGCEEFDMVIPVGLLKDGNLIEVFCDVRAVVEAAEGLLVKVILETGLLSRDEKIAAGIVSLMAGAHFLKTSTGFFTTGATVEDVELLRAVAGENRGVKAAGGIRDFAFAESLIKAGADRIGASATLKILAEAEGAGKA